MKTLIIDDELAARLVLETLTNQYESIQLLKSANSVSSAIDSIKLHSPDLIFLDIHLSDGNGFEILNAFPDRNFQVIFTTAHDEHAFKAFKYSAVDYLLKPIDIEDLDSAIKKISSRNNLSDFNKRLNHLEELAAQNAFDKMAFPCKSGTVYILLNDIIHLVSDGNYTTIYSKNVRPFIVTKIIKEYEEMLPEKHFYRTHKSHIVNINCISKFLKADESLELNDGSVIPLARRRKECLMSLLG